MKLIISFIATQPKGNTSKKYGKRNNSLLTIYNCKVRNSVFTIFFSIKNNTSDKMCWFFLRSYKYHIIK